MESKDLGILVAAAGFLLVVYEYWFSFCSPVSEICFFPFSPSERGIGIPLYSAGLLVFGLLLYFGSGSAKKEDENGAE